MKVYLVFKAGYVEYEWSAYELIAVYDTSEKAKKHVIENTPNLDLSCNEKFTIEEWEVK